MTNAEIEHRLERILKWLADDSELPASSLGKLPESARKLLEIERDRMKSVLDKFNNKQSEDK